jgi:hypothetical protein
MFCLRTLGLPGPGTFVGSWGPDRFLGERKRPACDTSARIDLRRVRGLVWGSSTSFTVEISCPWWLVSRPKPSC